MELSSDGGRGVTSMKYGLVGRGAYIHSTKHCNIVSVTYNSKINQYIILDSRGMLLLS